jgi:Kef-type K+ transport system membrane component KefB
MLVASHRLPSAVLVTLSICLVPVSGLAAGAGSRGPSAAVFLAQVIALLACGRLMSEFMQRIRQPSVMGQLIAGILLGPSLLGAIWLRFQQALFPTRPEQQAMIDATAQLGILLLLLLTGMETDLSVVRCLRKTAFAVSANGIAVPFVGGLFLGRILPDAMLPNPGERLVTGLFLGTVLSISSVKIVATVVREIGFLRRTIGQVIVAAAMLDDTLCWIIMSVILGLALRGRVEPASLAGC